MAEARGGVLRGVGVAVTRPGRGPGRLGDLLAEDGATVVHWPCIRFEPADDADLEAAMEELRDFDWLVLTSPRAARGWLEAWATRRAEDPASGQPRTGPPSTGGPQTAAVGPATASVLRDAGWPVHRVPEVHSAAGLLRVFEAAGDTGGARILLPGSDRARDELPSGLRKLGAHVDCVAAYRTLLNPPSASEVARAARQGVVRVVTFTSPSTANGFFAGLDTTTARAVTRELSAAAIGPTTAEALAEAGWHVSTAPEATLEGLVEATRAAVVAAGEAVK